MKRHREVAGRPRDHEVALTGRLAQEVRRGAGDGAGPARLGLEAVELAEHGVAALDDGRLLGEDRLTRVAQDLGVLQGDVGEHDDRRRHDVRGVEAPAEPRLQRNGFRTALGEGEQGGDREHLELRRLPDLVRQPWDLGAHALDGGAEDRLGHRATVHDHALRPAGDVRREVRARAPPVGAQQGLAVAGRGRLAVGADDVDDPVLVLRPAEAREQLTHALQPRPHAEHGERLEVRRPPGSIWLAGGRAHGRVKRRAAAPGARRGCRARRRVRRASRAP